MQFTKKQPSKREFIVSFTEIGIAFKAEASPTVLNILPVVGNKSLAGENHLYAYNCCQNTSIHTLNEKKDLNGIT